MGTVVKQRLNGLIDWVRRALVQRTIFYRTIEAQPAQNRIVVQLRDPARLQDALASLQPLISSEGALSTPDLVLASAPNGQITVTLSPVALHDRAHRGRAAIDRDRAPPHRRHRRGRSADRPAGHRSHRRAASRHRGPDRIKELLGTDRAYDLPAGRRDAPTRPRQPPPGVRVPADAGQPGPEDRRPPARRCRRRRPDRRPRRHRTADRRVGGELHLQQRRRAPLRRRHRAPMSATPSPSCSTTR